MEHRPTPFPDRNGYAVLGSILICALVTLGIAIRQGDSAIAIVLFAAGGLGVSLVTVGVFMRSWMAPLYGSMAVAGVALVVAGIIADSGSMIGLGITCLIMTGTTGTLVILLTASGAGTGHARTQQMLDSVDRMATLLQDINEHVMLSNNARRAIFRERERAMLHDVITQDIQHGEYEAAEKLCSDLEELFGQRAEADEFRAKIAEAKEAEKAEHIGRATDEFERALHAGMFDHARTLAARIQRLFPDAPDAAVFEARIEAGVENYKVRLEQELNRAAGDATTQHAMQLLRELDRMMSRTEAERLAPIAKQILERHKAELGDEFRLALNDHRWINAAKAGQTIIEEFPQSRMADEVRSMMAMIEQKATESAVDQTGND